MVKAGPDDRHDLGGKPPNVLAAVEVEAHDFQELELGAHHGRARCAALRRCIGRFH